MALRQIIPIFVNLQGDGISVLFPFQLANINQVAGALPSSVFAPNPPVAVVSTMVDANGNIIITLASPLGNGVVKTFELDLVYASAAAFALFPLLTENVNVINSSLAVTGTFWQATQPVSGTLVVSNFPVTQSVTQGTSPWVVSGTVTGNQGSPNSLANAWPVKITDGANQPGILQLSAQPTDAGFGLTTISVIHGHTTAGGGAYVDVKVNPSGSLQVAGGDISVTQSTSPWVVSFAAPQHVIVDSGAITVSGTVSTGGLTDTQLRATPVPISAANLPLPIGAATEATLALVKAKTDNLDVPLSTLINIKGNPNTLSFAGNTNPPVANQYKSVGEYTVPVGRKCYPISFRSLSAGAGFTSAFVVRRKMASYNLGTNVFTDGDAIAIPRYFFTLYVEVTTALSAAATIITATYTNQSGTAGRTATATIPASSIVGARVSFTLQAGDIGVIDVTNVTDNTAATGVIDLFGFTTITYERNDTANVLSETVFPIGQELVEGDRLSLETFASSVTSTYREIQVTFITI